jgi:DNA-directed RNA polymerase specialized sigma24 family protein
VSDTLFRTGYLMTADAGEAEDLVQETLLRVARRWNRVRTMDHPAAYARRILINLVLHSAGRRSRQKEELVPEGAWSDAADQSAALISGKTSSTHKAARRSFFLNFAVTQCDGVEHPAPCTPRLRTDRI